tara:strand:- start:1637 stop:1870 length:234 start_codon:yes stop_codon:yes gene_type:complete
MDSILIGCIKQTEADNSRRRMKDIITKILEAHQDINMTSKFAREYLAEEIHKEVKQHVDKMFMEEYEMITKPSTSPF